MRRLLAICLVAAALPVAVSSAATSPLTAKGKAAPSQQGQVLTYGMPAGIPNLDPNTNATAAANVLWPLLWNGLTAWGRNGTAVPDLATSWTASQNLRTWTFRLRSGVRFHSGRPFTGADAVANLKRVLNPKVPFQFRTQIQDITSVRAVNRTTLRIQLSKPNALLPTGLIGVKITDTRTLAQINRTPNGTGPFRLKQFVPDQSVTLVRNRSYWGPAPGVNEIRIVRESDAVSAFTKFQGGRLDMLWQVAPRDATRLGSAGRIVRPKEFSNMVAWEVDTTSPPFNDVRARQALAYSINRPDMLRAGYLGLGRVSPTNNPLDTTNPAFNRNLQPYAFNLQRARELFTAAGVGPGSTLTFAAIAGQYTEWVTMAQLLQRDLATIDINLKIDARELSGWLDVFYPAGKSYPNTIVANFFALPSVPAYNLSFFRKGACECNWDNASFQAILDRANATRDEAARTKLYQQAQAIFNRAVPVMIPAHIMGAITVARPAVTGVWIDSQGNPHLETVDIR